MILTLLIDIDNLHLYFLTFVVIDDKGGEDSIQRWKRERETKTLVHEVHGEKLVTKILKEKKS